MDNDSLLDRYEKLVIERFDTLNRIQNVINLINLPHINEETRNSLLEIIEPRQSIKRKDIERSDEGGEKRFKSSRDLVETTGINTGKVCLVYTCSVCKKEKKLHSFQEQRIRNNGKTYVYTHLSTCTYCRRKTGIVHK